jgi:MerC mercury resistance protein
MVQKVIRSGTLDRLAIALSGLCLAHCVVTTVLVALLASAGGVLVNPVIHEIGLACAIVLGLVALGWGYREHGRILPVAVGSLGIGVMAGALSLGHVPLEIPLTMLGVTLLSVGHWLNRKAVI